jgi:hypothetical protein
MEESREIPSTYRFSFLLGDSNDKYALVSYLTAINVSILVLRSNHIENVALQLAISDFEYCLSTPHHSSTRDFLEALEKVFEDIILELDDIYGLLPFPTEVRKSIEQIDQALGWLRLTLLRKDFWEDVRGVISP